MSRYSTEDLFLHRAMELLKTNSDKPNAALVLAQIN